MKTAALLSALFQVSQSWPVQLLVILVLTLFAGGEWVRAAERGDALGQSRFTLILDGAGVQDNQTGLVWEQSPDKIFDRWSASIERCKTKRVGGQAGWRAPRIDELKSLVDLTQKDPALPQGHPFSNIQSAIYWSATPSPTYDIVAWQVSFFTGQTVTDDKSLLRRMWCVRG